MTKKLRLALLGRVDVRRDDTPVIGFRSLKAQALLFYLVVTGIPHSRPNLAGLFWADMPEADARTNLRQVLTNLRRVVGPYLNITRQTVGLSQENPVRSDVEEFQDAVSAVANGIAIDRLREAAELYRGDLMTGFYVRDAPLFEEWMLAEQARLRTMALGVLQKLATHCELQGDYENGVAYARRLLDLEPWHEGAHRQVMRLLALSGNLGAALAQYKRCLQLLGDELGVEPSRETTALFEQIREGEFSAPKEKEPAALRPDLIIRPGFLEKTADPEPGQRPVFVARDQPLAWFREHLEAALGGHGGVAFVAGGPGRGKTALLLEFARRAMDQHQDLLVARGGCSALSGLGDPYLPFREVMDMLAGDVEPRWAAGDISDDHARRLWAALPVTVQTLLDHGPHLLDTFVATGALLSRARAAAPDGASWIEPLQQQTERRHTQSDGPEQIQLFHQFTNVMHALAKERPLLLVLDDLQWADGASVSLLFHLGRRLQGTKILIVGAYRPEELTSPQAGLSTPASEAGQNARRALQKALSEFGRLFGDVRLDLTRTDEIEGRRFVDELLDSEPNRLTESFRKGLFQRTGGHALFTVELLREMQERGDLVQTADGTWEVGSDLDWRTMPTRVEAAIEGRLHRVEQRLRELLAVASVEGETFTAQIIAHVQELAERDVFWALSQELGARHRLVREAAEMSAADASFARFSFRHALFRDYVYQTLPKGQRRFLHGEIAAALEGLYGERSDAVGVIAGQLAHHYAEAGRMAKAIEYSLRAGDQARRTHANEASAKYYQQGLALLDAAEADEIAEGRRQEVAAQLYQRLGELMELTGQHDDARSVLQDAIANAPVTDLVRTSRLHRLLGDTYKSQGRYGDALRAYDVAETALQLDPQCTDPTSWLEWVEIQFSRMLLYYGRGDAERILALAERARPVIERHGTLEHRAQFARINGMTRARRERYVISDETLDVGQEALDLCQQLGEDGNLAYALFWLGFCHLWRDEFRQTGANFLAALKLADRVGYQEVQVLCLSYFSLLYRRSGNLGRARHYARKCLSLPGIDQMPSYLGLAKASLGWLAWCAGELTEVQNHTLEALELWQGSVYPFQWTALWPLIGTALAQDQLPDAVHCARRLLKPAQQRLPDVLTAAVTSAIQAWDDAQPDAARTYLDHVVALAQEMAYF